MANERDLSPDMVAAVEAGVVRPAFLCRLEVTSGFVFVWSGIGDLEWNSNIYKGVGNLGGIDIIGESTDMTANSVQISLSGIPQENLELALNEVEQRFRATLWLAFMNTDGTLVNEPYQIFQGLTDVPEIDEGGENDTCTISIACESRLVDLNRAKVLYYTPEDQKLIDPTDKGFDFVAGLQNASIIFA